MEEYASIEVFDFLISNESYEIKLSKVSKNVFKRELGRNYLIIETPIVNRDVMEKILGEKFDGELNIVANSIWRDLDGVDHKVDLNIKGAILKSFSYGGLSGEVSRVTFKFHILPPSFKIDCTL